MHRRKTRKKRNGRGFAWPLLMGAGGLLILVAFLILGGRKTAEGAGTPFLAVDQARIDYGYVKYGENRQFRIKVTNTGDGSLRFKEEPYIEILEGC